MKKRITIITRHYPPNKNINGVLANEMAYYLEKDYNCDVSIVCMNTTASGNNKFVKPIGNIFSLNPYFNKKNKIHKLLSLINEGYRLIKKSKKIESDLIICTTSPPLLIFWASILLKKKNKWSLWSLDLFPEAFLANNQLKENSFLYKYLYKKTYKNAPNYLIALGQEQAKNIINKYNKPIPTIILPAGVILTNTVAEKEDIPKWYDSNKITFGYFGNISIAHNPAFIEKSILEANNHNHNFVLAVYGVHSERVIEYARQFSNVIIITDGLPQEHLSFIDVHLVSLMPSFTHIAVPSKAVTAISTGRPILFCGNENSDNWQMFKESGWLIDETKKIEKQLEFYFSDISKQKVNLKANKTSGIYLKLQQQVKNTYSKIPTLA